MPLAPPGLRCRSRRGAVPDPRCRARRAAAGRSLHAYCLPRPSGSRAAAPSRAQGDGVAVAPARAGRRRRCGPRRGAGGGGRRIWRNLRIGHRRHQVGGGRAVRGCLRPGSLGGLHRRDQLLRMTGEGPDALDQVLRRVREPGDALPGVPVAALKLFQESRGLLFGLGADGVGLALSHREDGIDVPGEDRLNVPARRGRRPRVAVSIRWDHAGGTVPAGSTGWARVPRWSRGSPAARSWRAPIRPRRIELRPAGVLGSAFPGVHDPTIRHCPPRRGGNGELRSSRC